MKREHILEESILPEGYTKLEYLENNGIQYIRTDFNVVEGWKYEVVFEYTNATQGAYLLGNMSSNGRLLLAYIPDRTEPLHYVNGGSYTALSTANTYDGFINLKFTRDYITISDEDDTETFGNLNKSTISSSTFIMFAVYSGGVLARYARIRGVEITDANDELVHCFVPALRDTDRKPGMFDVATNKFYTNAGTGEFLYK